MRSHSASGATAQRVRQLESLKAVAGLDFLANDIEDGVYHLGTFRVMSFRPVVSGTRLSEHEIIRTERLSVRAGPDRVHGPGFQIDEYGAGDVASVAGFIVVDVDPFQLKVGFARVHSRGVDSMFVGNDLPEFGSDLVSALAGLNVDDFPHCRFGILGIITNLNLNPDCELATQDPIWFPHWP